MERPRTVLLAILTDLSIDHRCFKIAHSLREAGYEPVILCDRPRGTLGKAWQGFSLRLLSPVSHLDHFAKAFVLFHLRLAVTLLFTRSEIWIALDCPPLFTVALLGKIRGAKVIYDSHELFPETPMVLSRPMRRLFWTFWHDAGLRLTRRIIAVSPTCAQWFMRKYPGHELFLLPNTPPLLRDAPWAKVPENLGPSSSPGDGAPGFRLFFQGGLRVASGLAETFAILPNLPNCSVDIYGDGPERANLAATVQKMALENRVRFHGQVPFEVLREPMSQAHIGIHLMQPVCESFALTLANKLFDYIHAGLPVLLSDNPAHRAFLNEHPVGVAVDSFSPAAIETGLKTLMADWDRFHSACSRAREAWQWDVFARDLPRFLETGASNWNGEGKA